MRSRRPRAWNEGDDWSDNWTYESANPSPPLLIEEMGEAEIWTGLLDRHGDPIMRANPEAKQPIGFAIPLKST